MVKRISYIVLCLFALVFLGAQATPLISSFNAGELSPKLDVRSDLEKYYSGCRTLENMIPLVEGGATRMPGTYFALETKDSSKQSRLIPFQFSTIQSYVIEAGDQYFRFFKEDGLVCTVDSYTKMLLHCDGTDESTTITDSGYTGHAPSAEGDAQIDTAQSVFGTGSILFDGTGDYVSIADHADFNMSTGAVTIDFWYRQNSGDGGLFTQRADDDNLVNLYYDDSEDTLTFTIQSGGGADEVTLTGTASISAGIWYHIAVIRGWGGAGNGWALCINGTAIDTETVSATWPNIAGDFWVGAAWYRSVHPDTTTHTNGWIDEFRVSKGVARWTSNFTPPTQEYPFADTGALTGGGATAYEVTTPYAAEDVFGIKTVQSADYLYIFHPDYPPKELTRTDHTSWTLSDMFTLIGDQMEITGITKANPAVVTCTTVPTSLTVGDTVYIDNVAGMTEVNERYFMVTTITTGAGGNFRLFEEDSSEYAAYTSGGYAQENLYGAPANSLIENKYPSCGTFFEQRLCLAGSDEDPQTLNCSVSADFDNFDLGTDDDDAIQYTILSQRIDRIYWLLGLDYLMAGTVGGIWKMGATSPGDPLTPTDINTKQQLSMSCKDLEPEIVTDSILWVTRAGTSVRQLLYSFEVDKYIAPDMTRIAKHIALGSTRALSGITQIDFQREPLPILWAIRADGQLLGMTYETQENIYAWFRVVTDGTFESIAVISEEGVEDEIWLIVNRTIGGNTKRYVEYFKPIEFFGQIEDGFFVHSGLTWDGGDAVTITGITKANPAVVTASGHTLNNGDKVRIQGVLGMTEINIGTDTAYTVASSDPNAGTFALSGVNSSEYTAYTSGGTVTKVTNSLSNLTHLEGESVAILIDGVKHDAETVSSGVVSLDWYGNKIHVGLPYTSIVEPMKLNAGAQLGTARGKKQKISRITVGFYQTGGGVQYGPDQTNLQDFTDLTSGSLTTDDLEVIFDAEWADEATISILQEDPLPMTILGIVPWVTVNES